MRWGIFGGCFDPIHLGHLRCAEEVREALSLEKVIFIPTGVPPHKDRHSLTPFHHRYEMVKLAIRGHHFFAVSDEEGKRPGVSYTIDTIEAFTRLYGDNKAFFFITGQDAFEDIRTWKDWERLIHKCNFVVMTRPGFPELDLNRVLTREIGEQFLYREESNCYVGPEGYGIYVVRVTFLDIKARIIRDSLKRGRSVLFLTPDVVIKYIHDHGLYTKGEERQW